MRATKNHNEWYLEGDGPLRSFKSMILPLDGAKMTWFYPHCGMLWSYQLYQQAHSYQMKPSNIKYNKYNIYIYITYIARSTTNGQFIEIIEV